MAVDTAFVFANQGGVAMTRARSKSETTQP